MPKKISALQKGHFYGFLSDELNKTNPASTALTV